MDEPRAKLAAGMEVTPNVRLVSPLAAGGMGAVWLADHSGLKTRVVVKFMLGQHDSSSSAGQRFAREAAAAAKVKSPHVVQMFDHGHTPDGTPFIVMEYLEGRDLAAEIAARGAIEPATVVAIVGQVAKALSKAHAAGLLHRDIKPDNIFLVQADAEDDLFVKLLDFGIAKSHKTAESQTDSQTKTGQVVGTPFYMSPEQVTAQKDIDLRSDLWALGIVTFEALTGKRPFDGPSFGALAVKIATGVPLVATEVNPALPPAFDAWFAQACARVPAERFPSAREMADGLRRAFDGVVSLPPVPSGLIDSGARSGPPGSVNVDSGSGSASGPVSTGDEADGRPSFVLASTINQDSSDPAALARSEPHGAVVAMPDTSDPDARSRKGPPRFVMALGFAAVVALATGGYFWGIRSNTNRSGDVPQPSAHQGRRPVVLNTGPSFDQTAVPSASATSTTASADASAEDDAGVRLATSASSQVSPPASASGRGRGHGRPHASAAGSPVKPPVEPPQPTAKPSATAHDDPLF